MPMNWKMYKRVTPVSPSIANEGSSLRGMYLSFFLKKRIKIIKGVATTNRRKPISIGDISFTVVLTAMNDPAQIRLMKIRRNEMKNLLLFIFNSLQIRVCKGG